MLPANFVWQKVLAPQVNVKALGVDVVSIDGTVWNGRALVSYRSISSIVDWDISLFGVFGLQLPISADIESQAGSMQLNAGLGLNQSFVEIAKADVDLSVLTPLVKRQRVELDGQLLVKDLIVHVQGERISSSSGQATWTGGNVAYPVGRSQHERVLPAFKAKVVTGEAGGVQIGVRDSNAVFDVIDLSLSPDGEAMLKVARRLLDVSNEAWPQNSGERDVVFKVKKMIY